MRNSRLLTSSLAMTVLLAAVLWIGRSARVSAGLDGEAAAAIRRAAAETAGVPGESARTEKALFSMFCYWTGEASLGLVPGVVASRIGSLGGSEVVEVEYDPRRTDPGQLAGSLRRHGGFYSLIVPDRAAQARAEAFLPASEIEVRGGEPGFLASKYSLRTQHPELYYLDLTEAQAIALNTWSYFGGRRPDVLTPGQEAMLAKIRARLAEDRDPGLEPDRAGEGRERYRRELLAWLGE